MNIKQKQGFSLIELMVVVAIIGILATVAAPNFMKFQAKAKQSSAKVELSALYTAQKAFQIEYNRFHNNLPYVGYVPDAFPNVAGTICPNPAARPAARIYNVGFNNAENGAVGGAAITCPGILAYPGSNATNADLRDNSNGNANAFVASASGRLSPNAPLPDQWTINQNKNLVNAQRGL